MSYLDAHAVSTTRLDLVFEIYDVWWRWASRPDPMNHYAQAANEAETRDLTFDRRPVNRPRHQTPITFIFTSHYPHFTFAYFFSIYSCL